MTARLNNEGNRERCQLLKQFVTCRLCRETQQNHKLNPRLFQLFSPALDHIRNICIHSLLGVLPSGYMVGDSCVHILIVKSNKTKTEVGEWCECLSCCVLHTLDSCVHVQTVDILHIFFSQVCLSAFLTSSRASCADIVCTLADVFGIVEHLCLNLFSNPLVRRSPR